MGLLHLHERPELDILQTKLSPIFAIKTNEKKDTHYNIYPPRVASPQTSFVVRSSRIHFSPTEMSGRNECVTNEPQMTSEGRLPPRAAVKRLFKGKVLLVLQHIAIG